ncbi:MAG: DUF2306 domain-containing protein [Silvibacterium sp.]|nr:DUF2306 domain-containing protein [Silvibacterium sp.]
MSTYLQNPEQDEAATTTSPTRQIGRSTPPSKCVAWSAVGLVAASWISAAAFGLYILCFYFGAIRSGHIEQWNNNLSGLYDRDHPLAFLAMAAHLGTGAIILLLGPVQLIDKFRGRWPAMHRWLGRLYVFTAFVAGLGGLGFIVSKGTIGGAPMNLGFGVYGALMVLAATETYRHARGRRFETHRVWAIRLFALAIGSWLYRMDYGFWLLAAHRIGHTKTFRGPFDIVMSFFFYLPNLAFAELFLRGRWKRLCSAFGISAVVVLNIATLVVGIGTYYFIRYHWGPGILHSLLGRAG